MASKFRRQLPQKYCGVCGKPIVWYSGGWIHLRVRDFIRCSGSAMPYGQVSPPGRYKAVNSV